MATITRRVWKNKITYQATVRLTGYPTKTASFDRQSEAMRWAEDTEHAMRTGGILPGETLPLNDKSMVDAVTEYLLITGKDLRRSHHTILTDRDTGKRLIASLGKLSLRTLTREDIEEHRDDRLQKVGPSSVRQDLSMLSRIYEIARIKWRMPDLPFPGQFVKLPKPPPNRKTILHPDQVAPLLSECARSKNARLRPLVLLLLSTGMRPEEAILLRWRQVDLDHLIIDLTKTKTEPRRVPIPDGCADVLREMKKDAAGIDLIFVDEETARKDNPARSFRRAFEQACIRAKINTPARRDVSKKEAETVTAEKQYGRVTLYTLRHSAATYLIMSGCPMPTVAQILGHAQISMTQKYTHPIDSHIREAMNNPALPWAK